MSDPKTPAAIAAELHAIAAALCTLPADFPDLYASLTLSDSGPANLDDAAKTAMTDTLALVALGEVAEVAQHQLSDGRLWYGVRRYGAVSVSVYTALTDPAEVSEVDRLRAELAEVRAAYEWATNADGSCNADPACSKRWGHTGPCEPVSAADLSPDAVLPDGITTADLALAAGCDCEDCADLTEAARPFLDLDAARRAAVAGAQVLISSVTPTTTTPKGE